MLTFQVVNRAPGGRARTGRLTTAHGTVDTPAFMPVGTKGSVKGVWPDQVRASGAQILLGNTYHLCQRPGAERVARLGGLHRFMAWDGPILTDSGGYQVFSLADLNRITDEGVSFRSHIDGRWLHLDPESATRIQHQLGADIIMAFDQCPPGNADYPTAARAVDRTLRWARICKQTHERRQEEETQKSRHEAGEPGGLQPDRALLRSSVSPSLHLSISPSSSLHQALFGIVQGGVFPDLRLACVEQLIGLDFPGYAIGGLSVGEPPAEKTRILEGLVHELPEDKPRYLMGVGMPRDLLEAVRAGVDMFDCVLPTRNARNSTAFTARGLLRLRNEQYAEQHDPLEAGCPCPTCRQFSRAYIRHLFLVREMLGPMVLTVHNLWFFQRFMARLRDLIPAGDWGTMLAEYPIAGVENQS